MILLRIFFAIMWCFSFIFERDDVFVTNEVDVIDAYSNI